MKAVNAYYRKHGTLDGCPHLSPENIENLKADMASGWHYEKKPFQSWELSNNNAEIRRVRQRIESLTRASEVAYVGWEFDGGHVEMNREVLHAKAMEWRSATPGGLPGWPGSSSQV